MAIYLPFLSYVRRMKLKMEEKRKQVNDLLEQYKFNDSEKKEFWNIINSIFIHEEFQKRLDPNIYPHHGKTSLGMHIINDAIVTYKISKKKKNIDTNIAVIIAMFHDLYELPWQNNKIEKHKFCNKHGFTHPIEAVINSANWFPEYYIEKENSIKIIDGIIHHMYPFPVRSINEGFEKTEINNIEKLINLNDEIKALIIESSLNNKIKNISFSKSKYIEGRIMSKADKIVSIEKELKNFNSIKACVTGKNPELIKRKG